MILHHLTLIPKYIWLRNFYSDPFLYDSFQFWSSYFKVIIDRQRRANVCLLREQTLCTNLISVLVVRLPVLIKSSLLFFLYNCILNTSGFLLFFFDMLTLLFSPLFDMLTICFSVLFICFSRFLLRISHCHFAVSFPPMSLVLKLAEKKETFFRLHAYRILE